MQSKEALDAEQVSSSEQLRTHQRETAQMQVYCRLLLMQESSCAHALTQKSDVAACAFS